MKRLSNLSEVFLSLIFLMVSSAISAFNYTVNFTASGASTTIDKVVVQNLTQGTTVTVTTGNTLQLTPIDQVNANDESVRIYPNPILDKATVSYYSNSGGNTTINVVGVDGKNLIGIVKYLNIGVNSFQLTLPKGAFAIQFNENGTLHTAKILSQSNNIAGIEFTGYEKMPSNVPQKAKTTAITMPYNLGDLILYKAYAGNYVTVMTDIVIGSKTMNFNFIECKDADGNYYSTVTIGTQVWMGENLKTTHYKDGSTIPNVTDITAWNALTTDAYCWLNNDAITNKNTYGALYNWYSVNTGVLAPIGWHIPSDTEWTKLTDYLGGINVAGGKLKDRGTTLWMAPNLGATNETGFTALPSGKRETVDGEKGHVTNFWTSTIYPYWVTALNRSLASEITSVYIGNPSSRANGNSVRCVLDTLNLPTITTTAVSNITQTTAMSGGNISTDGGASVTARGVCWSTSANPTTADSKTTDGTGIGSFTSSLTGLTPITIYHVRAYATNSAGTSYGSDITFTTLANLTVATAFAYYITQTTARSGGNITSDGGATVTARGVCWSTSVNPTTVNSKTNDGIGTGSFISNLTGLAANTVYHIRAYATNSVGTTYGSDVTFTTLANLPTITTKAASSIAQTTAKSGGNVTSDGGAPITARGVCWSSNANPTTADSRTYDGTGTGSFTSSLTGLTMNTVYHIRAYATNSVGTSYGSDITFTTLTNLPTVTTAVSNITNISATSGGNITSDGGTAVTTRGVCWSTSASPTISNSKTSDGTGTGTFSSSITGLSPGTTYYARAYATNTAGTAYGNQVYFTTVASTITDIDGNVYHTITIGTQTWMVENLKTTHYSNGDVIANINSNTAWAALTTGAWCDYSNLGEYSILAANGTGFGHLYNWYAVADSRNIAPVGWHVPTDSEWTMLENYLIANGYNYDGTTSGNKIAKSLAATTDWINNVSKYYIGCICYDLAKNNTSGFTSLPGGFRTTTGEFYQITEHAYWWSSNMYMYYTSGASTDLGFNSDGLLILGGYPSSYGFSVRCVFSGTPQILLPTVTTTSVSNIINNSATSGGNITSDGGATVTARGVCWSTSASPMISNSKTSDGIGTGIFSSSITGLLKNTTYYARAYATNSVGTAYGNQVSFSTAPTSPTVTDIVGNVYHTVTIGTQTWMVEDLKTTKYNNGTAIPEVTDSTTWLNLTSGAYCNYNNDAVIGIKYGKLYNWYAVNTGKLAPTGWHVATDAEWNTLESFVSANLGTPLTVAIALAATTDWNTYLSPNSIGYDLTKNNISGFTALPGGFRGKTPNAMTFNAIGGSGNWYTSTEYDVTRAYVRCLVFSDYYLHKGPGGDKKDGCYVRCIKD